MAAKNFPIAMRDLLQHEGGYDADPRDSGNWSGGQVGVGELIGTKYGIDAASHPGVDIKNLTIDLATAIYRKVYWDSIQGDKLPSGLDYAVFDFGVNSGPTRAVIYLQDIVGAAPDGKLGPLTLKAVAKAPVAATIVELCDARLAFLKRLSVWPIYKGGWTQRVKDVKALSLSLAKAKVPA